MVNPEKIKETKNFKGRRDFLKKMAGFFVSLAAPNLRTDTASASTGADKEKETKLKINGIQELTIFLQALQMEMPPLSLKDGQKFEILYTISSGDSLEKIAETVHGVAPFYVDKSKFITTLRKVNHISDPRKLQIGETINLILEVHDWNNRIEKVGMASWYGDPSGKLDSFAGKKTASGLEFDPNLKVVAHKELPIGAIIKIKRRSSGEQGTENSKMEEVIAHVIDRGPYHEDRILDVSPKIAKELGFLEDGTAQVEIEFLGYDKDYRENLS